MYATGDMSKSEKDEDNEQLTKCCRKSVKKKNKKKKLETVLFDKRTKSTHIQETHPKHILTTVKIH